MSTTPVCTDNSVTPFERRLQIRQQVSALAYLDIGPANGGIILNLSEEGMGFQAVSPLDGRTDVALRIQLPHSQGRIEALAKIVWLSQSSRQGGMRFLEMSAEERAQISNWISSQNLLKTPPEGPVSDLDGANDPRKPEPSRASRDKWLSLMAELAGPEPKPQSRQPAPAEEEGPGSHPEAPLKPGAPTIVLNPFHRVKPAYDASLQEPLASELPVTTRNQTAAAKQAGGDHPTEGSVGYAVASLDRPGVVPRMVPAGPVDLHAPQASEPALAVPSAAAIDSTASSEAIVADARSAASLAARSQSSAAKWLGMAALFVFFSALCFGLGTWLGSLGTGDHPVETAPAPATPPPASTAEPTGQESADVGANRVTRTSPEKDRASVAGSSARQARRHQTASPIQLPLVVPVRQNLQSGPAKPLLTPLTATKPQEISKQAPPADYPAAPAPAPVTVAGHILRPSDRFNPCHLTYRVEAAYPLEARQQGIEGAVKIHQVIAADGSVESLRLLSGPPLLAPAAIDAAKDWRYFPALLNGQPVATEQDIEIDFRLPR